MASALLELRKYVGKEKSLVYYKQAEKILDTLSTPEYFAITGNNYFVIKHTMWAICQEARSQAR